MCISSSTFPDKLKITDIIPVYKKHDQKTKLTIDQLVYYQLFQKHLKRSSIHS